MSDWLSRYNARRNGAPTRQAPPPPPQQYAPQPQYAPAPPAPPAYGPQPIPGAPPHAPFGYDQMTGQPLAPYGYHPNGAVALPPPPPQQYQQPAYGPQGLPQPQGYGQPPYGPTGPPQPQQVATWVDEHGQTHFDVLQAAASFQGGEGVRSTGVCPECHKHTLVPRGNGNKKLNVQTGQMVDPAPECSNCGYNGLFTQMGSTGGAGDAAVKTSGPPRLAPGATSVAQAAHLHGLPNLFARD